MRKKILISLLNKFDPAGESEIEGQVDQSNDSIDEEKDNRSATKTQLKRYYSRNIFPLVLYINIYFENDPRKFSSMIC